ncbi:hypothetical protein NBRC116593_42480 [Sulfitobacter pacificus]
MLSVEGLSRIAKTSKKLPHLLQIISWIECMNPAAHSWIFDSVANGHGDDISQRRKDLRSQRDKKSASWWSDFSIQPEMALTRLNMYPNDEYVNYCYARSASDGWNGGVR